MKEKLGHKSAFPHLEKCARGDETGMNKRFFAACAAMQGLLANNNFVDNRFYLEENVDNFHRSIAEVAYKIANEMLEQENE
jgi:hypothetical protein